MNLAFDLQKDKNQRDANPFQRFRLLSLGEMIQIFAEKYLELCTLITRFSVYFENAKAGNMIRSATGMKSRLQQIQSLLEAMGLTSSRIGAERFLKFIEENPETWDAGELKDHFRCLELRILDDLKGNSFWWLLPQEAKFCHMPGTILGEDVINRLPKRARDHLREDADEAGNCFAFNRYTACVFHLMRVMERVVQLFGQKVKTPIDTERAYWDTILQQVKKLTKIENTDDAKTKKKKNRYQAFYDRLDAVRVAWRNPTMHPKTTYTEEQAKEVIDAVRLFVRDFSTLR